MFVITTGPHSCAVVTCVPNDYHDVTAKREGDAIIRLNQLRPHGVVVHDSILWNKNVYRKGVQRSLQQVKLAKYLAGRFFSRTTPRGRKYRQSMKRGR
jgi:hypothetical protein